MATYQFTRPNKLNLLHDELIAAELTPTVVEGNGDDISITVPDEVTQAAVAAVVNAHDHTALTTDEVKQQETDASTDAMTEQYQAAKTRLDDIVTNGSTYTQAQARDAVVDLARIQRATIRFINARLI